MELLDLLRERFLLLQRLGQAYPHLAQALMRVALRTARVPTARVDAEGTVRVNPRFFEGLRPEERRWILLHEALHHLLDHPRRTGALWPRALGAFREQARRAREGRPMPDWDPAEWAAWRRAWLEAYRAGPGGADLPSDPWEWWEGIALRAWSEAMNQAADLMVHAWMFLLDLPPGTIEPPEGGVYPVQEEISRLLQASLEELEARIRASIARAAPGSDPAPRDKAPRLPLAALTSIGQISLFPLSILLDLEPGEGEEEGEGEGEGPGIPEDPLREGVFREIAGEILRRALSAGKDPGGLEEVLGELFPAARVPWPKRLRAVVAARLGRKVYDWTQPGRRGLGAGVYLPRRRPEGGAFLAIVRDTSGSMDPEVLRAISGEILALAREHALAGLALIDADAAVQAAAVVLLDETPPKLPAGIPTLRSGAALREFLAQARGRGGTRFGPALERIRALRRSGLPLSGVVYFTDAEGEWPAPDLDPGVPVWWVVPGPAAPPFGDLIEIPELWDRPAGGRAKR